MFQTSECVTRSFDGSVEIKKGLMGMFPWTMSVSKNRCLLDFKHKQFVETSWQIDLCREPVHIKIQSWFGEQFFLRQTYPCREKQDYCKKVDDLLDKLQNAALIYAKGERETINTDHGKFFCSYLLIKQYLMEGSVFSLTIPSSVNIFHNTPLEAFGAEEQKAEQKIAEPTPEASIAPTAAPTPVKGAKSKESSVAPVKKEPVKF